MLTITYHKEILPQGKEIIFPHDALDKEIRDYLIEKDVHQLAYKISTNNFYLFIYLRNGDRVDVSIGDVSF